MNEAFTRMLYGLLAATLLVYFIMVINYQSWTDPFVIITALPGAFCGIVWMLFLTGTTFSVPSLMGAIMSVGVATANSVLVVSFANEQLRMGRDPFLSVIEAGSSRLRPVLMTSLAMIAGMLPMASGLGEGGEQNAPLGRAVIGGLLLATVATLFFVPVVFSLLRRKGYRAHRDEEVEAAPEPVTQPSLPMTPVPHSAMSLPAMPSPHTPPSVRPAQARPVAPRAPAPPAKPRTPSAPGTPPTSRPSGGS
jgi:predicted RND superfamily exporter protein